jgi:hypothetical protein
MEVYKVQHAVYWNNDKMACHWDALNILAKDAHSAIKKAAKALIRKKSTYEDEDGKKQPMRITGVELISVNPVCDVHVWR